MHLDRTVSIRCVIWFYCVVIKQNPACLPPLSAGTMAVPPAYADLGKSAKDIFSKGFGKGASTHNACALLGPPWNSWHPNEIGHN